MSSEQKITTCLWFDGNGEDAAKFYTSIFKDSRITQTSPGPGGKPMTVAFELEGRKFVALNGGPHFKFTEAASLVVHCQSQAEVDEYWSKLTADGGAESMCGWLKDKFGLSWQVIPDQLVTYLSDPDPARAGRAMQAMMKMRKIDLAQLERAAAGA